MVERGPEQRPGQHDLPKFSDLQFPTLKYDGGYIPDGAPDGFVPYSNIRIAYDSTTGNQAIVGERTKKYKHRLLEDRKEYYILGEDLLPMHDEPVSSITGIGSNKV